MLRFSAIHRSHQTFLVLCFFIAGKVCYGQASPAKKWWVVDSVHVLKTKEERGQLSRLEASDSVVLSTKGVLKQLGWVGADTVVYVFTKAFRNRDDTLIQVPGLRQMQLRGGLWSYKEKPYTGRFIDYDVNGNIQVEGSLLNGYMNGTFTIYYPGGKAQSVSRFESGQLHGLRKEYYPNGELYRVQEFSYGRSSDVRKTFFMNGQLTTEWRKNRHSGYDSIVRYYSSGKIRSLQLFRNCQQLVSKKEEKITYYSYQFNTHFREGNLKEANRDLYQLWLLDSTSLETKFKEGLLYAREYRFNDAIASFDNVLKLEPFFTDALVQRTLARINKYRFASKQVHGRPDTQPLVLRDLLLLPKEEQVEVCGDLQLAKLIEPDTSFLRRLVPEAILSFCSQQKSNGK